MYTSKVLPARPSTTTGAPMMVECPFGGEDIALALRSLVSHKSPVQEGILPKVFKNWSSKLHYLKQDRLKGPWSRTGYLGSGRKPRWYRQSRVVLSYRWPITAPWASLAYLKNSWNAWFPSSCKNTCYLILRKMAFERHFPVCPFFSIVSVSPKASQGDAWEMSSTWNSGGHSTKFRTTEWGRSWSPSEFQRDRALELRSSCQDYFYC